MGEREDSEVKVRMTQVPRITPRFVACVNRWMKVPFTNVGIYSSKHLKIAERR